MLCCAHGQSTGPETADGFLIVDCKLPPRVRQIGTRATYLAARTAARLSAAECARSGGEFALEGESAAALAIWLPIAERGDAEAQNVVGEIFERGVGSGPDHEAAVRWYRRAAEQGLGPAQVNLGRMYDSGTGVARDPIAARQWYLRAAGLDASRGAFVAGVDDPRVAELEQELARRANEISRLRRELSSQIEKSASPPLQVSDPGVERELDVARVRIRQLEEALASEADRSSASSAEQRKDIERLRTELTGEKAKLAAAEGRLVAGESIRQELDSERVLRSDLEQRLDARGRELEQLRRELETARADAARRKPDRDLELPGPSIQLIEPTATRSTRGIRIQPAAAEAGALTIVGRVDAEAGLLALTVSGTEHEVNELGIFRARVQLSQAGNEIAIVAVDRRGKRAEERLRIRAGAAAADLGVRGSLDFGRFHALVVGNDRYSHLPRLTTARNDAQKISAVLEQRYGFQVRTLLDANRYEILSEMNRLRGALSDEDSLLIYYAGHGELEEENQRGYWLPVDAESESTANWISNVSITDILNTIRARHVIVISDSCYSGSLTRSALARLDSAMTAAERNAWIRAMVGKRSRTALTSGGLAPVMDQGGGEHSVFARALLEALAGNETVMEGQRLHQEIAAKVAYVAENHRFEQIPQYAPIKFSGHESGDFFFVPRQ